MKCYKPSCEKPVVYERKYEGTAFCKQHFLKNIEDKIRKMVGKYKYIRHGDRVGVALSGGKDSSVLLYVLNKLFGKYEIKFIAITIDEGIAGYRNESIEIAKKLCSDLKIEHRITSYKELLGQTLDSKLKISKEFNACTYCGVARRWCLNKAAKEAEVNKLAVGHNLDDEAQSIMMDYIKGDLPRLVRMDPNLEPKEGFIRRIKPLRSLPEKEIGLYAFLRGLKIQEDECPNMGGIRFEVRDFLNNMEAERPGTKNSILETFEKIVPALKQAGKTKVVLKECEKCGEPCSGDVCKTCELWC